MNKNNEMMKTKIKDNSKQLKWLHLFTYFGCFDEAKLVQRELDGMANSTASVQASSHSSDTFIFD
jgi:hypothetical protein